MKSARRVDVDRYLSAIESELMKVKVEQGLLGYNGWSTDLGAVALKKKIDSFSAARDFLKALRRGYHRSSRVLVVFSSRPSCFMSFVLVLL